MTDRIKHEIDHLLDDACAGSDGEASRRLRAKLAATLSEGLNDSAENQPGPGGSNLASMAAFVDGRLTGAELEEFLGTLAGQESLRADSESAADLVSSISAAPRQVPEALLARARAELTPASPSPSRSSARWGFSLASLLPHLAPRQRLAFAALAALVVVSLVPAGLMIGNRFAGSGGQPELSEVPEPSADKPPEQSCKDKAKADTVSGKSATAAPDRKDAAAKESATKDDCDKQAPKQNDQKH
jgi:hypothetical protein